MAVRKNGTIVSLQRLYSEMAERWAGAACTLNGRPAKVTGRLNRFATVAYMNGDMASVEFSWPAVETVMLANGGRFRS